MRHELAPARWATCLLGGSLIFSATPLTVAAAFPALDPSNEGAAITGTNLAPADVTGLQNQIQTQGQATTPTNGPGWTIIPRVTLQEELTDNAFEVTAPRRFDAITVLAPGVAINADTPRLQLKFDYQPNLTLHAINGDLNAMSQQLSMIGLVTVVPDLAYVDVRGISGVQSRLGGVGGTLGAGADVLPTAGALYGGGLSTAASGLNRYNEVQTTSLGVSPYLLTRFQDYGVGKIGASVNIATSNELTGFATSPFPTDGANSQSALTTEEIARFTTGEAFGRIQDSLSADLSQSRIENGSVPATSTASTSYTSERQTINNQISYALNRTFTALASFGYQDITYGTGVAEPIHGLIWSVGMTITPDPDSSLTITYGHINGANSITASGHYALTARTLISVDYSSSVGTQLENLQSQLNANSINVNGQWFNPVTGGVGYVSTNALGAQNGVYRYNTLNASLRTAWTRDTVQMTLSWSVQTNLTPGGALTYLVPGAAPGTIEVVTIPNGGVNQATDTKTATLIWTHDLTPDMTMSTSASYGLVRRPAGIGNDSSVAFATGVRYALSEKTAVSASYSFFDRVSGLAGNSLYENVVLLGITRHF
jgi:hypothetical protein